jgi:hypothetical protein
LLRRQRWGGLWFEASLGKKFTRPHINQKKLDAAASACPPHHMGIINRRIVFQASLDLNSRPYWKKY